MSFWGFSAYLFVSSHVHTYDIRHVNVKTGLVSRCSSAVQEIMSKVVIQLLKQLHPQVPEGKSLNPQNAPPIAQLCCLVSA